MIAAEWPGYDVSANFDNFHLEADQFTSTVPEPGTLAPAAIAARLGDWLRRRRRG